MTSFFQRFATAIQIGTRNISVQDSKDVIISASRELDRSEASKETKERMQQLETAVMQLVTELSRQGDSGGAKTVSDSYKVIAEQLKQPQPSKTIITKMLDAIGEVASHVAAAAKPVALAISGVLAIIALFP